MTKKLAVIFLENPPYLISAEEGKEKNKKNIKNQHSYVWEQMKNSGMSMNHMDMDYYFIWSVFNIYNPYAYIHFGPIKCWKSKHLIDKEVKAAYLCNRKYFNAAEGAIALLYWTGKDKNNESITFDSEFGKHEVKKVHVQINTLLPNDTKENAVIELAVNSFSNVMQNLHAYIGDVHEKSKANLINKEHLLTAIPIWVAAEMDYSENATNPINGQCDFRIIDTENKCADGGTKYQQDTKFLQDCLLYTLCTHKATQGLKSDGMFYKVADELLDNEHKSTEIYKLYKQLVDETGTNGLKNIEKYKSDEFGKLYVERTFGPTINKLCKLLLLFQYETIRPKMLEYELLK